MTARASRAAPADHSLSLFWLARTVSLAGSAVTAVVLPILIYQETGSPLRTALTAAIETVPYLLFGVIAGAVADRVDRRRLMVGCDLACALLLGSVPLAAAAGRLTVAHLYVVAALAAFLFVWFDAASFGALPRLAGRDRLVRANSRLMASETMVAIAGPAAGAALAATIGGGYALGLDAASYAVSALLLSAIRRPFNAPAGTAAPRSGWSLRSGAADVARGISFLWRQRLVRTVTLLTFGLSLTGGGVAGLMVVYAVQGLGLDNRDGRIGLLFSVAAAGSLLASLVTPWLAGRLGPVRVVLTALAVNPPLLVALVVAPGVAPATIAIGLWEATYSLVTINGVSLRQLATPDAMQGRVNAAARTLAMGGQPIGAAIAGALAEVVPVRSACLVMGTAVAVSAVAAWLSPLRAERAATGATKLAHPL